MSTTEESSTHLATPLAARLTEMTPNSAADFLIEHALAANASDLFFDATEETVEVSLRRFGIQKAVASMPFDVGMRCISHLTAEAGMQTAKDRRQPREGHMQFTRMGGQPLDLRLHSMPVLHGESLSVRMFHPDSDLRELESLGFLGGQIGELNAMLQRPGGLILITGPSGCGKSATVYSCLHRLNNGTRRIHTIEAPVEYAIPGIRQTVFDVQGQVPMAALLRAVLRQGPDVVMIGEIRDPETADAVVSAANSGRLVLATMNAPYPSSAVQQLRNLGVSSYFLSTALLGILGQRLVRKLNPDNRIRMDLSAAPRTFEEVSHLLKNGEGKEAFAASETDGVEGYTGLTSVFQVLKVSPAIRELIAKEASPQEIALKAGEEGITDLRQAAMVKVAQGITSFDEVHRIVPAEEMNP